MEPAIDFKSLRAKFQEDIQSKERPVVPEKPKRLPPPAGISGSIFAHMDSSAGAKNLPEPAVVTREDRKAPSAKRPVSVPSCFQATTPHRSTNESVLMRQSFKERHVPQVLPVLICSDSSSRLVTSPIKYNKAIPTPFKPTKFSKCIKDILEHAGEAAEKSSVCTQKMERSDPELSSIGNGLNHCNGGSDCVSLCPNQEQPVTPPPTAENVSPSGSVTHVLSTLEKAKRKFSPKNLLAYAKPKSFYSTKVSSDNPPPLGDYENLHHEAGSVSLLAEDPGPRSPASSSPSPPLTEAAHGTVLNADGEVKPVQAGCCVLPDLRPLPLLASLGPEPPKPPRPPQVDLCSYKPCSLVHTCSTEAHITTLPSVCGSFEAVEDFLATESPAVPPPPLFDAPDFPDFESSVLEALNINGINLSPLDLEGADFGVPPAGNLLLPPAAELQKAQRCDEMVQRLLADSAEAAPVQSLTDLECWTDAQLVTELTLDIPVATSSEISHNGLTDSISSELPSEPSLNRLDACEVCNNVYEEVEMATKFHFGQNSRKRKETPKNPYADSALKEETHLNVCYGTQCAGMEQLRFDHQEDKELRKREKQRLERERKERKEREKKENEMKKKFKITGLEKPVYHARVLVASKLRKCDLQVKSGDTVSIIRTTNCPKGKWLARDSQHNYGYISVMNVELNMKEMLELGRRASQTVGRGKGEADATSLGSRSSHQNPVLTCSFSDDSEEWSGEETVASLTEHMWQHRAVSMPDVFHSSSFSHPAAQSGSSMENLSQVKHEALQKLAVFFQSTKEHSVSTPTNVRRMDGPEFLCAMEEPQNVEENGFAFTDIELLPPPELYADSV